MLFFTRVFSFKRFSALLIFLIPLFSLAQNVEFTKDNFPDKKDELKAAIKALDQGDEFYRLGKPGYAKALELFLKAYQLNPKNAELNLKIGTCYLNSSMKPMAAPYLESSFKMNPKIDPKMMYYLGRAYHLNLQWDEAIDMYTKYKNSLSPAQLNEESKDIAKKIEECNNGKYLVAHPVRVFVDNLGPNINGKYPDYSPVISADESILIFTSRRPETTGEQKDPEDDEYFEDIMISEKDASGNWQPAKNLSTNVNSPEHDSNIGLTPDASKLFIYKGDNGGDVYLCVQKGIEWTKPDRLDKIVNTKYHESAASYSFDGKILYFVSDRPDLSMGGRDVLYSTLGKNGKWSEPKNIGPVINTKYDDDGVFIHPDGKTMYFSSKGHNSMGGYDIFKTVFSDSLQTWSAPQNIGYPINTADDDIYFVVSASGLHGYFTSVKKGGYGEKDIYMLTFLGPEKKMLLSTEDNLLANIAMPVSEKQVQPQVAITTNLTILKGRVLDAKTNKPLEAALEITDNEKNEVIATFLTNSETGKYLVTLPSGKNYGIAVTCEDYFFHSENLDIPASQEYQEITKDFYLRKPEVGESFVLKNVFFDFDKATLRSESTAELERLKGILMKYPTLRIELGGHTDSKGSDEYNQKLSESRAKSVMNYLIEKAGIPRTRLEFVGYGELKPIATNETDEGRQLNRRTEFKILAK